MERLTYTDKDGGVCCPWERNSVNGSYDIWDEELLAKQIDRLAAYEDTGLEPGDVRRLQQDWTSLIMTLDEMGGMPHLRELVQAEKGGRLVVLPCKVGDTVFRVFTVGTREPVIKEAVIKTAGEAADLIGRIGKKNMLVSVFRTREEAEAALAGKGGAK